MDKTFENNKLIAEFMGFKFNDDGYVVIPESCGHFEFSDPNASMSYIEDHLWESSFDWLMPVVEKLHKVSWAAHDNFRKVCRWSLDQNYNACVGLIKHIKKNPKLLYENK